MDLGTCDRHAGLKGYCTGLMLPLTRKSVEPMAARIDPLHASARHQSLHHFVAKAEWSDEEMLRRVAQWVVPKMDPSAGGFWIIDDTGFPKQGKHSVGVARQYCGHAGQAGQLPGRSQHLPGYRAGQRAGGVSTVFAARSGRRTLSDAECRGSTGRVVFATKTEIALQQLETLLAEGAPKHCVLADAGYGVDQAFRQRLTEMGLPYVVGDDLGDRGLAARARAAAAEALQRAGSSAVMPRRHEGVSRSRVKDLALQLPAALSRRSVGARERTKRSAGALLTVRVRHAGRQHRHRHVCALSSGC